MRTRRKENGGSGIEIASLPNNIDNEFLSYVIQPTRSYSYTHTNNIKNLRRKLLQLERLLAFLHADRISNIEVIQKSIQADLNDVLDKTKFSNAIH
jgi:hypothetical protein